LHLPIGADREELRRVRGDLATRLAEYLGLAPAQLPAPLPEVVHCRPHFAGDPDGYAAVEDSYEYDATLTSIAPEELQRIAVEAFNGLPSAYGVQPFTHERIVKESRL